MPLQSQQQAKYLNWRFGHQWLREHHFQQPWHNLPKYKAQLGVVRVPFQSRQRTSHTQASNRALLLFRQLLASQNPRSFPAQGVPQMPLQPALRPPIRR